MFKTISLAEVTGVPDWLSISLHNVPIVTANALSGRYDMSDEKVENPGIEARLLEVLACPQCRSQLAVLQLRQGRVLQCRNPDCRRRYPVRESIPVLLVEESEVLPRGEFDLLEL